MATKRDEIRRTYRMLRVAANKPQWQVEQDADLGAGRYWRIENGLSQPTANERRAIAKALGVTVHQLPTQASEAVSA